MTAALVPLVRATGLAASHKAAYTHLYGEQRPRSSGWRAPGWEGLIRTIRWIADRSESFLADVHGRDHVSRAELALDDDGRFLAMRAHIDANLGAYCPLRFPRTAPDGEHRSPAAVYIEEYSLSSGLRAGDAVIAATAVEHDLPLYSDNAKHFRSIRKLRLTRFSP